LFLDEFPSVTEAALRQIGTDPRAPLVPGIIADPFLLPQENLLVAKINVAVEMGEIGL
jgi:hypothetical protein